MLWGAFTNAGSAMQAMSWDLATIGQNIANVNTNGYKAKDTLFQTSLSEHLTASTSGNPVDMNMSNGNGTNVFGVRAVDRNLITTQGNVLTTGVGTDLAINGDGFFIVAPGSASSVPTTVNLSNPSAAYYTRDGSFQQQSGANGQAYFVNASGDYLMGWMADPTTGVITQGTLSPVYTLPTTTMAAVATTTAQVIANIPSDSTATPDPQTSNVAVTDNSPTPQAQSLKLNWSRVNATTWTVSASSVSGGNIAGTSPTYTVTTDGSGNIQSVTGGTVTPPATAQFDVTWNSTGSTVAQNINLGPLAPSLNYQDVSVPIYDASSQSHSLVLGFEKAGADSWYLHFDSPELRASQTSSTTVTDAAGQSVTMNLNWTWNGGNTWTVSPKSVTGGDSASGSATVTLNGAGAITAVNGNPVPPATTSGTFFTVNTPSSGSSTPTVDLATALPTFPSIATAPVNVTFDGNGKIISPTSVSVTATWGDGQTTTTAIDISKLTQYSSGGSGKPTVNAITQNGYLSGALQSSMFNDVGELTGSFSNGQSRTLFKVPLATFVAPNSLMPISGNMFQLTKEAGAVSVQAVENVGTGGNGTGGGTTRLVAAAVEGSNVDLQTQMSNMILAQKAYSTNAQVFKTADEMTTVARDLHT